MGAGLHLLILLPWQLQTHLHKVTWLLLWQHYYLTNQSNSTAAASDNMYMYEGEDYSKLISENDKRSFDQLLAGK